LTDNDGDKEGDVEDDNSNNEDDDQDKRENQKKRKEKVQPTRNKSASPRDHRVFLVENITDLSTTENKTSPSLSTFTFTHATKDKDEKFLIFSENAAEICKAVTSRLPAKTNPSFSDKTSELETNSPDSPSVPEVLLPNAGSLPKTKEKSGDESPKSPKASPSSRRSPGVPRRSAKKDGDVSPPQSGRKEKEKYDHL